MSGFLGHRTNGFFFVVIALLVIALLTILVFHLLIVNKLRADIVRAKSEASFLDSELAKCREDYSTVLADVKAFDNLYRTGYGVNSSNPNGSSDHVRNVVKRLGDKDVWGFYHDQGIINESCIVTSKLVATDSDVVDFVIAASGSKSEEYPILRVLVDAQEIDHFVVQNSSVYRFSLLMPAGTHYLDLLYDNADKSGGLSISAVRIGNRLIDDSASVIDEGSGLGAFDCESISSGSIMDHNSAMRFRIEKV